MPNIWAPRSKRRPELRPRRLRQHREELLVLGGALRGKGPFLLEPLVELVPEEGRFHATVDDVPWQDDVGRPVAKDVEVGIDAGFGDRRAPIAAVALRGFDCRGDAPIAK